VSIAEPARNAIQSAEYARPSVLRDKSAAVTCACPHAAPVSNAIGVRGTARVTVTTIDAKHVMPTAQPAPAPARAVTLVVAVSALIVERASIVWAANAARRHIAVRSGAKRAAPMGSPARVHAGPRRHVASDSALSVTGAANATNRPGNARVIATPNIAKHAMPMAQPA
jgi:hypothetical protein